MGLWSDFLTNQQRLIDKWAHYFPVYERHFAKFVNTDVVFIEIGVGLGGSLQLWKRFLGPHARIVGIDIDPTCRRYEEDQIAIRIGNQADESFLLAVCAEFGLPDVVLDDGSHHMRDITASFGVLYPRLARNGVYLVEDLHTAYWPEYGGGVSREGTFIELSKSLIDSLNADHTRGVITPNAFTRSTTSMHFYDSIVVFEKGRHTPATIVRTGGQRETR